jgi:hypothetical protein
VDFKEASKHIVALLQSFSDANSNPEESENFRESAIDDMDALAILLQHPIASQHSEYALWALTVGF